MKRRPEPEDLGSVEGRAADAGGSVELGAVTEVSTSVDLGGATDGATSSEAGGASVSGATTDDDDFCDILD